MADIIAFPAAEDPSDFRSALARLQHRERIEWECADIQEWTDLMAWLATYTRDTGRVFVVYAFTHQLSINAQRCRDEPANS